MAELGSLAPNQEEKTGHMDAKTPETSREKIFFTGHQNNKIAADLHIAATDDPAGVVLLVHGGGQTRHSWRGSSDILAKNGWTAITMDQRGHGDSEWSPTGAYDFEDFSEDLICVADQIADRFANRPVAVGASLGGIASMLAEGQNKRNILSRVILVDVTPRIRLAGVVKILGFMAEHAHEGFASLEEAADAIATYLPHRPRPRDLSGLAKNLRKHDDGRYHWHWDPKFIEARRQHGMPESRGELQRQLENAVRRIEAPTLLIRGRQSELVDEEMVAEFMALAPNTKFADVSEAGHMVAGDKNDIFTDAVLEFLDDA